MVFIDAVTIITAIALAGLGIFVGFGRTLEFFTKGIFGFIISVLFCAAFGGLIAGIGPVAEGINWLNAKLGEAWEFLATIHLATVITRSMNYIPLVVINCQSSNVTMTVTWGRVL